MWYVYILKCVDCSYYTGITKDIKARFKRHLAGRGAKYTRAKKPLEIIYTEKFNSKEEAQQRENEIKKLSRKNKENIIKSSVNLCPPLIKLRMISARDV